MGVGGVRYTSASHFQVLSFVWFCGCAPILAGMQKPVDHGTLGKQPIKAFGHQESLQTRCTRPLQTAKQWNLWWQWPTMIPASLEISWTFSVPGFGHRRSLSEYEYEYGKKAALLFMTKLSNYWGMEPQICSIAMSYNTGQKACSISRVQEFPNCGLTTTKAILSVKPFQSRGMNSVNLWINDSFRMIRSEKCTDSVLFGNMSIDFTYIWSAANEMLMALMGAVAQTSHSFGLYLFYCRHHKPPQTYI